MGTTELEKILFHDFKHHRMTGVEWIRTHTEWNEEMHNQLLTIGSAQLDYYTGSLHVEQIRKEIYLYLSTHDRVGKESYKNWLDENGGYQEVTLPDQSRWTLRMVDKEEYIHIHPSRQSPYTLRIKGNTLKTVLCVLALNPGDTGMDNMNLINQYRKEYLKLSPIKEGVNHNELANTFRLFSI